MKTSVALALLLLGVAPLHAQVFHPATIRGAVLGGVAGAVIGNNSGDLNHNAWRGAAIGTAAGALLGSAIGESHERSTYRGTQVPVPSHYYSYGPGYRHHSRYGHDYPYRMSRYSSFRGHRPSYASSGLLLGGISGAIIGHNSHSHNAWRGAAIGAGAGLLLGSLADRSARAEDVQEPAYEMQPTTATQTAPQNITIINNYYGTPSPMSSANGMFGR